MILQVVRVTPPCRRRALVVCAASSLKPGDQQDSPRKTNEPGSNDDESNGSSPAPAPAPTWGAAPAPRAPSARPMSPRAQLSQLRWEPPPTRPPRPPSPPPPPPPPPLSPPRPLRDAYAAAAAACAAPLATTHPSLTVPLLLALRSQIVSLADPSSPLRVPLPCGASLTVAPGDITSCNVDAVVTAANAYLAGGGGGDGAVHRAAGPALAAALDALPWIDADADAADDDVPKDPFASSTPRPFHPKRVKCPPGNAVATRASGALRCSFVIHAVGPIYDPSDADCSARLLRSSVTESLRIGAALGCRSVALPAISCGVYGYPHAAAARVVVKTLADSAAGYDEISVVLSCSNHDLDEWKAAALEATDAWRELARAAVGKNSGDEKPASVEKQSGGGEPASAAGEKEAAADAETPAVVAPVGGKQWLGGRPLAVAAAARHSFHTLPWPFQQGVLWWKGRKRANTRRTDGRT